MRFSWIAAFVPDARGVRWAFGLLLLPAVWLAKGGGTPVPAAPATASVQSVPTMASAVPQTQPFAPPAPDSVRTPR